jgi:phosphatidylglycerophosphatase C
MPAMSIHALLVRLEAARAEVEPGALLAFDADGTLWDGDVTSDLARLVMKERPLLPDGLSRLQAIAAEHHLPLGRDVYAQLALLALGFAAASLPDVRAVECMAIAFSGLEATLFEELAVRAIEQANLKGRFRPELGRVFEWAHARGLPVVVVSASPCLVVRCALSSLGLEVSAVLGAESRVSGGRLTPDLTRPVLVGQAKVEALRLHSTAPVLAAFGDDVRDLPLLGVARLAVAVQPTAQLLERSGEIKGLVGLDLERRAAE